MSKKQPQPINDLANENPCDPVQILADHTYMEYKVFDQFSAKGHGKSLKAAKKAAISNVLTAFNTQLRNNDNNPDKGWDFAHPVAIEFQTEANTPQYPHIQRAILIPWQGNPFGYNNKKKPILVQRKKSRFC